MKSLYNTYMRENKISKYINDQLSLIDILADRQAHPEWTVEQLCQAHGIVPKTYYNWLRRYPEIAEQFRELQLEATKQELMEILSAKGLITKKLIEVALQAESANQVVAAARYLDQRQAELLDLHRARGTDEAAEFLSGPNLSHAESKVFDQTTYNVKPKPDGSLDITVKSAPPQEILVIPPDKTDPIELSQTDDSQGQ